MNMEVEFFSNVLSEEDTVEVDADYDNLGDEGERCGICMDIVIDRGVLDCCQHWFCFVCIDNWATITNLCPLCQNEFQLITCVPVYDTISGDKIDEDSDFRDDHWSVEGKNNNLSFPSYYIDENAVTCLDGDRCKIRSGSVTYEETMALDTSIACDSCDIWYHAFCVGFDPEGTSVDSWLCPRCLVNEADQNSDLKEFYHPAKNDDQQRLIDTSSGKLSICVADSGETAMVVSRIGGEDVVDEPITNHLSNQELTDRCKVEQSVSGSDFCSSEMIKPPDQNLKSIVPSVKFGETVIKCEPYDGESRLPLNAGLSSASTLPGDDNTNALSGQDECLNDASIDKSLEDVKVDVALKSGAKRKRPGNSSRRNIDKGPHEGKVVGVSSNKKVKIGRRTKNALIGHTVCEESDDIKSNSKMIESSADDLGRDGYSPVRQKKNRPIDIMSIVQGTKISTTNRSVHQKEVGKSSKAEKNAAGLRVKKIMRRPNEEKESDSVVEKLRKEIRDTVRSKSSSDIGKSILDPNLLRAFRAAVAGSVAEPAKKAPSAIVKAKKLMLQKGKARENLTKKIYATSSGKRRRAWDRDCEIEFWKHRCLTTAKPEKVETLRSVLNLLKRGQGVKVVEQNSEEEAKAPILSRLYLADTSLFPRKDDIQPLSVLKAAASSNKNEVLSSTENHNETCTDDCTVKPLDRSEDIARSNAVSTDDKKSMCSISMNESASGKFLSKGHPNNVSPQKKMNGKTDDVKFDKRKWALEFLARKSASDGTVSLQQTQENTAFKGNYPLLAELPIDMRPKLAPTRQNKIPISVRQAQLYRLTEHFLKMTNLPSMRRTADTELAVADAVNIEKQVADRSNSKVVYLNLCSQEIRNRANSDSSSTLLVSTSSSPQLVPTIGDSESTPSPAEVLSKGDQMLPMSLSSEAEAALRAAGLLSDSPPNSPLSKGEDLEDDDNLPGEVRKEESESIFEMDCNPDLDIYGDFDYDLDEEDYIGAAAIKASNVQAEEGESKVKVIFSSLSSVKSDNAPEANEQDLPVKSDNAPEANQQNMPVKSDNAPEASEQDLPKTGILSSTTSSLGCSGEVGGGKSPVEDKVDHLPLPGDTSLDGEVEQLSVAECEALYGPDNELSNKSSSNMVQAGDIALQSANNPDINNSDKNTATTDSVHCDVREKSSSDLDNKGKVDKQKNKNHKVDTHKVDKKSEHGETVLKKVEAYIKEHIRPLCKSGVITVDQYRWAVGRTTEKVMNYHTKSKNANFLIKEGEKVKKLAEQYVETAKHKEFK